MHTHSVTPWWRFRNSRFMRLSSKRLALLDRRDQLVFVSVAQLTGGVQPKGDAIIRLDWLQRFLILENSAGLDHRSDVLAVLDEIGERCHLVVEGSRPGVGFTC